MAEIGAGEKMAEYKRRGVISISELKEIIKGVPDDAFICFKNIAGDNLTANDYTILMETDSQGHTFKKLIFDNESIREKRAHFKAENEKLIKFSENIKG